jgi:long-subunit acyl-CoA synthetase (AMP-forming)
VRGPTVVRCYFNNEKANKESWDADGYLHTGDIMYCDGKTKKWYIVDRKKVRFKPSNRGASLAYKSLGAHQGPRVPSCSSGA